MVIAQHRREMLESSAFYKSLTQMVHPQDFAWCASLYNISKEFIEVLRLRNERFQTVAHDVFEHHYEEELGHAQMLREWMIGLGLEDPETTASTIETENFISCLYRTSSSLDEKMNLIVINALAEAFAFDFYCACYDHLKAAGFQNLEYWNVHAVADEEHSDVFHLLDNMSEDQVLAATHYVNYAAGLIKGMLVSWA